MWDPLRFEVFNEVPSYFNALLFFKILVPYVSEPGQGALSGVLYCLYDRWITDLNSKRKKEPSGASIRGNEP